MYATTPTTDTQRERRLRALVLEPDAAALRAARRALAHVGFDVLGAPDGVSGVDLLLTELLRLDVVVVALDLPGRDARGLAHLVRGAGGEEDLALVVTARGATPALRAELSALGVDAVVDRSEGPHAVAAAALAAVGARAASSARAAASPAGARVAASARPAGWTAAFAAFSRAAA